AVEACRPDTLLMTGQAGGADCIRLERGALNLCDGQDSAGMIRREEPAYLSAPAAYFATCDYGSVKAMLSHMGIVSAYSFFAGTYLCNYVLYTALHLYPDIPSGFLHLPYLDTQTRTPPFISARMAEQAVRTAVQALFE
ncbi:MAG: hypothetical protein FWF86_07595, partial [Clostridia bacterium]|nr:hypothetical protein [Clostridia bacterium]